MATDNKYEVWCRLDGQVTRLSRHKTKDACHRRFIYMSRVLIEATRSIPYKLQIWTQDPKGKTLEQQLNTQLHNAISGDIATIQPALSEAPLTDGEEVSIGTATSFVHEGHDHEWAVMLKKLAEAGVASITLEYDGSGDSGQYEGCTAHNAVGEEIEVDDGLIDDLQELCDEEVLPSGYENNDGGYGEITVDVPTRTIELSHNQRFTDTEWEGNTWSIPPYDPKKDPDSVEYVEPEAVAKMGAQMEQELQKLEALAKEKT